MDLSDCLATGNKRVMISFVLVYIHIPVLPEKPNVLATFQS